MKPRGSGPRVGGVSVILVLIASATGCSAGVYGAAAEGQVSQAVTITTAATTPTLGIRVSGKRTVKRPWTPFLNTQLTHASQPHGAGGRVLLALKTRHEPFGAQVTLVQEPRRGSRYALSTSVRGSANLTGRTVLLALVVDDKDGRPVNFAVTTHRLSSGWRPLSARGRVPITGGHDLRAEIYVARPTGPGPPSWLEIRGVSASGASLAG